MIDKMEEVSYIASRMVRSFATQYPGVDVPVVNMAATMVAGVGAQMMAVVDPVLRILLLQAYLSSAGFSESQIKRVTRTLGDA